MFSIRVNRPLSITCPTLPTITSQAADHPQTYRIPTGRLANNVSKNTPEDRRVDRQRKWHANRKIDTAAEAEYANAWSGRLTAAHGVAAGSEGG